MTDSTVETPDWLLRDEHRLVLGVAGGRRPGGRRRGAGFVAKTLVGAVHLARQSIFSEEVAARRGLLQRVEPRVKLLTTLALLVLVGLLRSLPLLVLGYAGTVALAAVSGLSVGYFAKRVWFFIPIFTGIVIFPATLSIVTPGHVVLTLWRWHGSPEGFTAQGLHSAGFVITRVATSISLVVLLTLTTSWVRLLAALRALGMPKIFVLTVGMAHRYLFLLLEAVDEMYTARKARTVTADVGVRAGRRFVAATAGTLFGKAHHLSEEVHQAMIARGYVGNARSLRSSSPGAIDAAWVGAVMVVCSALVVADLTLSGVGVLGWWGW